MDKELKQSLEKAKNARDEYDKLCMWNDSSNPPSNINDQTTKNAREEKERTLKKLKDLL